MFCPRCGNQSAGNNSFCPHCGYSFTGGNQQVVNYNNQGGSNGFAIAGFVLSFFSPILGIIFSCIGYSKSKINGNGRGLSIAGIIISSVWIVLAIILVIIVVANPELYDKIID